MTNEIQLQGLIQRLEKLERQNRRMKLAGGTVLVVGIGALLMGQVTPQSRPADANAVIEAQEIKLRDANGKLRVRLSATKDNSSLVLLDESANTLVTLQGGGYGSGLSLHDKNGIPRASIGATEVGEFMLFDEAQKPRVVATAKRSYAGLGFYDDRGESRISFGTSKDDTGLVLYDKNKKYRAILGTTSKLDKKRAESSLALFDENGKVLWDTP